jgi:hypothetical protein
MRARRLTEQIGYLCPPIEITKSKMACDFDAASHDLFYCVLPDHARV